MFDVVALACNRNLDLLGRQIEEFRPRYIHCNGAEDEKSRLLGNGVSELGLTELVRQDEVDIVVTATTGDVAIAPTLAAISARKQIALANKETIVMAGDMVTSLANSEGVDLMPLDSEPNAIWQCVRGERATVSRLIITASGGAFRDTPLDRLSSVTPAQALRHPTWEMGRKITVDSATLMNKAFEVIEAHWLFGMPWEDIEVVVHPAERHPLDGGIRGRLGEGAIEQAGYAPADTVRAAVPGARGESAYRTLRPGGDGIAHLPGLGAGALPVLRHGYRIRQAGRDVGGGAERRERRGGRGVLGQARIGFTEIEQAIRAALDGHRSVKHPDLEDIIRAGRFGYDAVTELVGG